MKKFISLILALATVVFSASTCEKMDPGDYRDFSGEKINLLGSWVLTEVQYKTAGVIESHPCEPQSVMEFALKGIGYTRNLSGEILDSWHYETFRASVTIYTNAEWENNRALGEDDPRYERGKTFAFHVVDENTISSEEKVSSNSYLVNYFSRFNTSDHLTKAVPEEQYSPNTLIVMYDTDVGKEPLVEAVKTMNAEIIYDYSIIPGMAIRIPNGSDIHMWIAYFKSVKGVVSVERDRINHLVEPVKPRLEVM